MANYIKSKDHKGITHTTIIRSVNSPKYHGTALAGIPGNQRPLIRQPITLARLMATDPYAERFQQAEMLLRKKNARPIPSFLGRITWAHA